MATLLILLLSCVGYTALASRVALMPDIKEPSDLAKDGESYLAADYIKYLEAAGARVVPILYDFSEDEVKHVFSMVNGVLFPGGNYPLTTDTQWFKTAELIFNLTLEANDRGEYFPLHGTCLGLELLIVLLTRDQYALSSVDASNHPTALEFTEACTRSAWLRHVPSFVLGNMVEHPLAMHNHHYGLLPSALDKYPELDDFFDILTYSRDRAGTRYISTIEARNYPITGIAFHPEKTPYEWTTSLDIPHSRMALDMAYHLGAAWVSLACKNSHRGESLVDEDKYLIYNHKPLFIGKHTKANPDEEVSFEQIYIFKLSNHKNSDN